MTSANKEFFTPQNREGALGCEVKCRKNKSAPDEKGAQGNRRDHFAQLGVPEILKMLPHKFSRSLSDEA